MTLPDFLGIGAQKSGTTWLARSLESHPQVWMAHYKELHYFDWYRDHGIPKWMPYALGRALRLRRGLQQEFWHAGVRRRFQYHVKMRGRQRRDLAWDLRYFLRRPSDRWYASLFTPGPGQIAGEITPGYGMLAEPEVAHVAAVVPDARIIFLMRHPVERAWSQVAMRIKGDRAWTQAQQDVPAARRQRRLRRLLEESGSHRRNDYIATLNAWGSHYPPERIFVGFLEDIQWHPEPLFHAILRFLGISDLDAAEIRGERVRAGSTTTMPVEAARYLAELQHAQVRALAERFGGYATGWLASTEWLLNADHGEEEIPYPLWSVPDWQDRDADPAPMLGLQSMSLAASAAETSTR